MTEAMSLDEFLAADRRKPTGMTVWLRTVPAGVPTRVPDELVAHYRSAAVAGASLLQIARSARLPGKLCIRHFGDETWVALLPPTDGAA